MTLQHLNLNKLLYYSIIISRTMAAALVAMEEEEEAEGPEFVARIIRDRRNPSDIQGGWDFLKKNSFRTGAKKIKCFQ